MSKKRLSPGPWRWESTGDKGALGRLRAGTGHSVLRTAQTPSEADAAVIAAAPEMMELLREAAEMGCNECTEPHGLSVKPGEQSYTTKTAARILALLARIDGR